MGPYYRKLAVDKPFSLACERNQEPIRTVLSSLLTVPCRMLEIGSGTGQHAVYLGHHLPHVQWQTSDLPENHTGIHAWLAEAELSNVLPPLVLDMGEPIWPAAPFDAIFTANTCHIMAWPQVCTMVAGVAALLVPDGLFCIYGPFNYQGTYTSVGNAQFDAALTAAAPHRAIRDSEALIAVAQSNRLRLLTDYAMPSNNRLLVFQRQSP